MIKQSGKELTAIYISAGDPDYYFGLQPLVEAFPNVPVLASESVVKHIEATKDAKIEYWGPILAENAPQKVIVPKVDNRTEFVLNGGKLRSNSSIIRKPICGCLQRKRFWVVSQ